MQNFSEACERNKQPILDALDNYFTRIESVLEVGSGSGQHALHFVQAHPHLIWQTSDCEPYFDGVAANIAHFRHPNTAESLPPTIYLDIEETWPTFEVDAVYTTNTLHIIPETHVIKLFTELPKIIKPGGWLFIYGPFRYQDAYTSASNADFDRWLKARDLRSGIRDMEWVQRLAEEAGFVLKDDIAMPANNQLLIWQQSAKT